MTPSAGVGGPLAGSRRSEPAGIASVSTPGSRAVSTLGSRPSVPPAHRPSVPHAPSELVPLWLTGRQYPAPSESVPQAHRQSVPHTDRSATRVRTPNRRTIESPRQARLSVLPRACPSSRRTDGNRDPSESTGPGRTNGRSGDAYATRHCPSRTGLDKAPNETRRPYPAGRGQATLPPS